MRKYNGIWQCPHCGHRTQFDRLGLRYVTRKEIDADIERILKPWTLRFVSRTLAWLKNLLRFPT